MGTPSAWTRTGRLQTLPQYAGLINHLRCYMLGQGVSINVTCKQDEILAKDVKAWPGTGSASTTTTTSPAACGRAVWNLDLNGETATRVKPNGSDYPVVRTVDTSRIRGPHNEAQPPWSFGVLT